MEMILLMAVLVLIGLHVGLAGRVKALEARLEESGFGPAPPSAAVAPPPASPREGAPPAAPLNAPPHEQRPAVTGDAVEARLAAERPQRASFGAWFERMVGGNLLIWIGGIALAIAGIFLVRFSAGLITPGVRMVLAALFGLVLLAGGEVARSRPGKLPDPRVPQALVGAGILVLYAVPYGALTLYALISVGTASTLMVMVTAAALVLSLRHGAPAGVMGLAGGFATPLLVGDLNGGAIPLLFYLALLDIALFAIASRRSWTWLAASAVLLSLVWSGFLLGEPRGDALAAGGFIVALSVGASVMRAGPGWQLDFIRPAALGLVELAVLVARVDLGLPAWGLFGLLSLASFLLATRRADYRPIPAFALLLALILLAAKSASPEAGLVAAGTTLIVAGCATPLALRRREPLLWTVIACIAAAGPVLILRLLRPALLDASFWGLLMLGLALVPLGLAWVRRSEDRPAPRLVAAGAALLLGGGALSDLLPRDWLPAAWMALALATAWVAGRSGDATLSGLAALAAAAALAMAAMRVAPFWPALLLSLGGVPPLASHLPGTGRALLALAVPGLMLLGLLRLMREGRGWLLGAALFCLVTAFYLVFKQAWGLASQADFVARGFAERLIVTQALFAIGWLVCRFGLPGLGAGERRTIGIAFTAAAAARLLWFDLLIDNPVAVAQSVGPLPIANLVLPAYLLSAAFLYSARRGADNAWRSGIWLSLFLAALVAGLMLLVRQAFQGPILTAPRIPAEESYLYSLAGLLLSLGLLLSGVRLPDKALRIAGLGLLTATTFKVFLVDASKLEGLLRILSFLGLGVALIGIGQLYRKVLDAERKTDDAKGREVEHGPV
jgi:uncharacterized membrane protein